MKMIDNIKILSYKLIINKTKKVGITHFFYYKYFNNYQLRLIDYSYPYFSGYGGKGNESGIPINGKSFLKG